MKKIQSGLRYILLLAPIVVFAACTNTGTQDTVEEEGEFDSLAFNPREETPITRDLTSATGKGWTVHLVPMPDVKQVRVSVEVKDFEESIPPVDFGENDPVIAVHQADLDKDGFEELYLITQSADAESYGTVLGLCSDNDRSVSTISFEGASPYNTKEGESYEGYDGRDAFSIIEGVMTNVFPVYLPADNPGNPTGGKRKIYYELVKGDASMVLRPVKSEWMK